MQVKNKAVLGQLTDMDIRLLRVFKSVVECGGMAAAELELNIGTSTVSRHVKDLETRLGLTLCRRGRSGFALTPEGQQIYTETLRLLAVFDQTASNPQARISAAIAQFAQQAPDVSLCLHVAPIQAIERGVIDGQFQVGVIPGHRNSDILAYDDLFGETMHLYCGAQHPLFAREPAGLDWDGLRRYPFAGLGYHSPNMEFSQQVRLPRKATGFDQESIATLILSGQYLGFLPEHYAEAFVQKGRMRAVQPALFRYDCRFLGIVRRTPEPSRATRTLQDCLRLAHAV
jgi:DNA-binding transcriptional LysR family regulator